MFSHTKDQTFLIFRYLRDLTISFYFPYSILLKAEMLRFQSIYIDIHFKLTEPMIGKSKIISFE